MTDLWKSERGLLAVLIIIGGTVLAALGHMAIADWQTFVTGIFITYAAAKTVTSAVSIAKGVTDKDPPVVVATATPSGLAPLPTEPK